jgi:hypothetical protein
VTLNRRSNVGLALALMAGFSSLNAQRPPKGVEVGLDTFTGDTIYSTAYGRLDQPNGCGRSELSIVWELARGKRGQAEFMVYNYISTGDPLSLTKNRPGYLGGHSMFLNVDGEIFEVKQTRESARFGGDRSSRKESGAFVLPDSTLYRVAMAQDARLRIIGTERTCDGIIEPNMKLRLRALLSYLKRPPTA